jgi:hypothetical protein
VEDEWSQQERKILRRAGIVEGTLLSYDASAQCVRFALRLAPEVPLRTNALDLGALFERYPDLRRHCCACGRSRSFYTEAQDTELVHLLEHIAVELLAQADVSREVARGATGIPRDGSREYRLEFVGAPSADTARGLLLQAAEILATVLDGDPAERESLS